jgi:hypothetical protein
LSTPLLSFFLLCSRHHPSLLQLNGSGSHLYTAHLHTMRSMSLSGYVLLRLLVSWGLPLRPSSLLCLYYNTGFWVCQEVFSTFFKIFFSVRLPSPPDTIIIPHSHGDFNRQNTQIWEKIRSDLCTNFLLTNC